MTHRRIFSLTALSAALVVATAAPTLAQNTGGDFHWTGAVRNGGRVSVSNVNGNIRLTASSTGGVEVTGTKRGTGGDAGRLRASVEPSSDGLVICVLYDDENSCNDRGNGGSRSNHNWRNASINLDVSVPASAIISAAAVSGDIQITGATGDVEATAVSGDIHLDGLRATSISAHTVSGDIRVRADEITGRGELSFHSVSGDIVLEMPRQFDADLSMSTVSGGLDSDYQMTLNSGRASRRSISARIGSGGRTLDLSTVSGDVKLKMGSR